MNQDKCKTILLVEDEAVIALAEKKILEKHGYSIIVANSGEEACELVRTNHNIDLILMDIDLGNGIDGTETAIRILNEKIVPVVFLSSHTEPEIVDKTEKITSYGYVVKNSGNTVLAASIKMAFKLFEANMRILESENKQKAMISNISDVIGIISPDGILKYKSTNIEKWFGWKPDDLIGTDFRKTVHPGDAVWIENEFVKILSEEDLSVTVEYRFKCKNDVYKWVELTAVNCINNPAINGVLINYHNITERKQAEEAIEKRIIALTLPLVHDTAVNFNDLFNPDDIQLIQDEFASATMVASIITHPDGTPITRPSNFTHLCEGIVRKTEKGLCNCYKSDAELGAPDTRGPIVKPCLSGGLWDAGASITVGGHHIANWLVGQVRDETQTDESMLAYAREIGADEADFLKAFHEVPSMSQDQFHKVAQSLYTLANQLSNAAFQNMEQARFINERKDIEEQLRKSEEKYRSILENSSQGIVVARDGDIKYANPVSSVISGYTLDEIYSRPFMDFIYPDDRVMVINHYQARLAGESDNNPVYRFRLLGKQGNIVWCEINAVLIEWEGSAATLNFLTNITDQMKAEKALRESESKYRSIFENVQDIFYRIDLDGVIIEISPSIERYTGYTREQLIGRKVDDVYFNPDDRIKLLNNIIENGEVVDYELQLKAADERKVIASASSHILYDSAMKPAGIEGTLRDITERKKMEQALLESERNLRLITDNMHETVWLMDMDLNITWMSPSVEKIRGYTLEELAGFSLNQHLTKESFSGLMQLVAEELTPEKLNDINADITIYLELEFCRKDGSTFWGDTFATVIRDSEGKPSGILCTGRDISEQKASNKALRDSEKRLSYALEATSDGLYDMNLVSGEIYCNSRYYNMIGYELYEIPPSLDTWKSMLYPDDRDYAIGKLMDMLAMKDEFMEMEYRIKTKNGGFIWVLDRSKIVEYDASGKPVRIVGTHVDISERKQVEETLRNSEKIHRLLADNVSDVIWTMDFSGHFTYVSPSVERLRGYTPVEVLQQSLQSSLAPESAAVAQAAFENAVMQLSLGSGDPEFHGEIEQLCKDGTTVWTEVRTSIMRNDSGEIMSILGVTRDISERRRSDAALKESEEKYRILVEHSSDLIWSLDSNGEFIYASPSWEKITGYSPSVIIGTNFSSIVHPDDYQICLDTINKAVQLKEIQSSPVYRIRHADGSWHVHEATGTPVIGPDGVSISIVGFSRDITESREAEEKIQNLLKEKELILKEVHHRVKNNMSTILNLLTLQLDMQDNPQTKGVLFDAAGRVQSMMVLYNKLYRSDSENMLSLKEYFTALVWEIISLFPGKESLKLKLDIDDFMLSTKILSPLGIIINELITNSMKYAFSGMNECEIELKVFRKDKSVQIVFRDNGKGLPESVSFEKSTGFGMQLISMLTSQIKGKVYIDRERGTCFIIEFDI